MRWVYWLFNLTSLISEQVTKSPTIRRTESAQSTMNNTSPWAIRRIPWYYMLRTQHGVTSLRKVESGTSIHHVEWPSWSESLTHVTPFCGSMWGNLVWSEIAHPPIRGQMWGVMGTVYITSDLDRFLTSPTESEDFNHLDEEAETSWSAVCFA